MNKLLIIITILLTTLSVDAQTLNEGSSQFVLFNVGSQHTNELKQIEVLLKNNQDFKMVRVDYSTNVVFIVSKEAVVLSEAYLKTCLGEFFTLIQCTQTGIQGRDALNFEEIINCNSK